MADLYGTPTTPSSSNQARISSYFQALRNSSSSSSCMTELIPSLSSSMPDNMSAATGVVAAPPLENGQGFAGSRGASQVESPTGLNMDFSDPGAFLKENVENGFFSVLESDSVASCKRKWISSENDFDEFSCDSEKGPEASEVPLNPLRPRSSSKRSRAAEVHNLSEKRRRSRINEKMKALQSLVPNSNKTDKASMLDEAIEYLKQLQLQVQMLTLRNGLGLPPMCLPGAMQPLQLPHMGRVVEDTFFNRRTGIAHANQERSLETFYSLPNHCTPSSQSPGITSLADITNAETSYKFDLPVQALFEQLNPSNLSEEICRENLLPQAVDADKCCNNPSSGIS